MFSSGTAQSLPWRLPPGAAGLGVSKGHAGDAGGDLKGGGVQGGFGHLG